MTILTTNTQELDIGTLLKLAMQTAGIMPLEQAATGSQWDARCAYGRAQLEMILDKVPMGGVIARDVEFSTITFSTLFGGENDPIVLASDTVDVVGTAMYRLTSTAAEQQVQPVDRQTWQTSLDKSVIADPTRYYVDKGGASVKLYLLPVPGTVGATLRIQRKRLLADSSVNSATVDLERYWLDYLHFELAWRFSASGSLPMEQRMDLRAQANAAEQTARQAAKQTVPNRIELDHGTGW